jgi:hypothetical protein
MRKLALVTLLGMTLADCGTLARNVDIDIDPQRHQECVNLSAYAAIPVAVLGSPEIDVRQIDLASVELLVPQVGGRGSADAMTARYEYLNADAYEDLLLQIVLVRDSFRTYIGPTMLTATLFDGTAIKGTETICVVGERARRYR